MPQHRGEGVLHVVYLSKYPEEGLVQYGRKGKGRFQRKVRSKIVKEGRGIKKREGVNLPIPADSESEAVIKIVSLEIRFMKIQVPVSRSYKWMKPYFVTR
jgi:hypothetical protein